MNTAKKTTFAAQIEKIVSMNRNMIAGNWKMNTTNASGEALVKGIVGQASKPAAKVVFGVPYVQLAQISDLLAGQENFFVAAQNCHHEESGAYTGEIAPAMLAALGVDYVILGHSERRDYFGETDELIGKKVRKVIAHGMQPIYCCGEKLETRQADQHEQLVAEQIKTALFGLSPEDIAKVVIAYEPVWAIGTGVTASPEQAQEMHAFLRSLLAKQYGDLVAQGITILYGGSMKPDNAKELLSQTDVDGGLVGGASLKVEDFVAIIQAV